MSTEDRKPDASPTPQERPEAAGSANGTPVPPAAASPPAAPPSPDSAAATSPSAKAAGAPAPDNAGPEDAPPATPTERIIEQFGGIRPMAAKLAIPVTTVQGWKRRNAIPEQRHADILAAARQFGITVDPAELAKTTPANPAPAFDDEIGVFAGGFGDGVPPGNPPQGGARGGPAGGGPSGGAPRPELPLPVRREDPPAPPPPARRGGWAPAAVAVIAAIVAVSAPFWSPDLFGGSAPVEDDPRLTGLADRVAFIETRLAEAPELPVDAIGSLTDRIVTLETTLSELERSPDTPPAETGAMVEAVRSELSAATEGLSARVAAFEPRLTALETRLADLPAGIDPAALDRLARRLDAIEGEMATIGAVAAGLEAVEGRLDAIEATLAAADGRLAAVEARARVDGLDTGLTLGLAAGQLRDAIATGGSVEAPLAIIEQALSGAPALADPIATLRAAAEDGIPTLAALEHGFAAAADAARVAARRPADGDWLDQTLGAIESIVTVRPAPGEVAGDDAASVLARAEGRLGAGDLAGAVAALDALDDPAAAAMAGWRAQAQARLDAEAAAAALSAALAERVGATTNR